MDTLPLAPDPQDASHVPVLLHEVLDALALRPGATVIDGTLGGGGHSAEILQRTAPDGHVLGLDADPAAIRRVRGQLAGAVEEERLLLVQSPFEEMSEVVAAHDFGPVDGILLDLGLSSFQLETADRGFSFSHDGPLDMRFDPTEGVSAGEIVNGWPEDEIANLIFQYGEERRSRRIAKAIVRNRPLETTAQLAEIVERAVGGRKGRRTHPATKTFQALRIAVNRELEQLAAVLPQCLNLLRPGGRMAIISFHSLEDRLIKRWMQEGASDFVRDPLHPHGGVEKTPTLRTITRKPVVPTQSEIEQNPRSRSAKLRVAEKI